jgi:hypothetical protein
MIPEHKHLCFEEGTQSAWLYARPMLVVSAAAGTSSFSI